jgi:hypothetical protein
MTKSTITYVSCLLLALLASIASFALADEMTTVQIDLGETSIGQASVEEVELMDLYEQETDHCKPFESLKLNQHVDAASEDLTLRSSGGTLSDSCQGKVKIVVTGTSVVPSTPNLIRRDLSIFEWTNVTTTHNFWKWEDIYIIDNGMDHKSLTISANVTHLAAEPAGAALSEPGGTVEYTLFIDTTGNKNENVTDTIAQKCVKHPREDGKDSCHRDCVTFAKLEGHVVVGAMVGPIKYGNTFDAWSFESRAEHLVPGGSCGVNGDRHFKMWRGRAFDYHGECHLVLLKSPKIDLDVHVHTTIRKQFSFVESALLRIGSNLLEVQSKGVYYLNGELGAAMPNTISGYPVTYTQPAENQHVFDVKIGRSEHLLIKVYKDFVSLAMNRAQNKHFGLSSGMMGDFVTGNMMARDGKTVLQDPTEFGNEWQVLDTEASHFQATRLPQYPQKCNMPPPAATAQSRRRRLGESLHERAAEEACAHWGGDKEACIYDVLATGDLEMAQAGMY